MSDLQKYFGNQALRWMTGNAMPAPPSTLYAALFDGDPTGAGVEVTTQVNATGRVAITLGAVANDGSTNTISNTADTNFGASANAVANVDHVALYDAQSGGNLIWMKAITATAIQSGAVVKILAGALDLTVGNPGA